MDSDATPMQTRLLRSVSSAFLCSRSAYLGGDTTGFVHIPRSSRTPLSVLQIPSLCTPHHQRAGMRSVETTVRAHLIGTGVPWTAHTLRQREDSAECRYVSTRTRKTGHRDHEVEHGVSVSSLLHCASRRRVGYPHRSSGRCATTHTASVLDVRCGTPHIVLRDLSQEQPAMQASPAPRAHRLLQGGGLY